MTADPTRETTSEDNLGVKRIFHININCRNLEVSLSFYQRLGFKVLKGPDHIGGRAGDSVQTGLGFPERTHGRGALLRVGEDVDATLVDLIEWTEPATHGDACDDSRHVGVPRIALLTADLHAAVRELKGSGVEFLSDPVETKVLGAGERWVCFKDPDGLVIELFELLGGATLET